MRKPTKLQKLQELSKTGLCLNWVCEDCPVTRTCENHGIGFGTDPEILKKAAAQQLKERKKRKYENRNNSRRAG